MHETAATFVITHRVRPGQEEAYEAWLAEAVAVAKRREGHMGVNVIRPRRGKAVHGAGAYTIVVRFDSHERLRAWAESEERAALLSRIEHALEGGDRTHIVTGLDFWFTPPEDEAPAACPGPKTAKPWKQYLVTLSAVYPLILVLPDSVAWALSWLPVAVPPLVAKFVTSAVFVAMMVYVVMPRYTRLIARWLYA